MKRLRLPAVLVVVTFLLGMLVGTPAVQHLLAQTAVGNTAASLVGKFLVDREDNETITGLKTFSRSTSPPFAVNSGAAKVTNLNADTLDGLDWSTAGFTVVTTTATGTQNDFAPGLSGNTLIVGNNASLLTITGIAGGYNGQRVIIESTNAEIDLPFYSTSSAGANRLINFVNSGPTRIVGGVGATTGGIAEYIYDGRGVWKLLYHEQGGWITPTYSAGNFTGSAGTWVVDSGDVTACQYYLKGQELIVAVNFVTTTTTGTPQALIMSNAAFGGYSWSGAFSESVAYTNDGAAETIGRVIAATATTLQYHKDAISGSTWTASTNGTYLNSVFTAIVQ